MVYDKRTLKVHQFLWLLKEDFLRIFAKNDANGD